MKKLFYLGLGYLLCEAIKTETGQKTVNYLKKKGTSILSKAKEKLNEAVSETVDENTTSAQEVETPEVE
jgi:predicted Fe-Mo cluster-binding NifX family protein